MVNKGSRKNRTEFARLTQSFFNATYSLAWGVLHPNAVDVAQRRMTRIVKDEYVRYINALAIANPKAFWHVYETDNIGVTKARLFNLATPSGRLKSRVEMQLVYRPSKYKVKIDERLAEGGSLAKDGKYAHRRHVFVNKAFVLETGQNVVVRPKNAKKLVYAGYDKKGNLKAMFSKGPIRINTKLASGGSGNRPTYLALNKATIFFNKELAPKHALRSYNNQTKEVQKAVKRGFVMKTAVTMPSRQVAEAVARKVTAQARTSGVI